MYNVELWHKHVKQCLIVKFMLITDPMSFSVITVGNTLPLSVYYMYESILFIPNIIKINGNSVISFSSHLL